MSKSSEDACVNAVKARLEAYGIPPHASMDRADLRRRKRTALGIVLIIAGAIAIGHFGSGQPLPVVLSRLTYIAIELPVLFLAAGRSYDHALLKRYTPFATVALSAAASASVGLVMASLWFMVGQVWPVVLMGAPPELRHSYLAIVTAGIMVGVAHLGMFSLAVVYPFAAHDARVRALEVEKLKTAAELARLRGHLEPHFLLNTLNAIAGLVTEDPREARRLLAALGDLLRDALRDGDEMQSVEQEEAWLRRYAEILESRHKGALSFRWEIDPAVRSVLVPRLLLQPLVENAVKHGALRRRGGGSVSVRAARGEDDRVVFTVEDDGPGFSDGPIRQGAVGLNVVRRRLELRFPNAELRIESSTDGTRAIVEFLDARTAQDARAKPSPPLPSASRPDRATA